MMSPLYQESSRPGVGRVLEAARDVSPGQPVLQEECLVSGPDGLPVCLGCLAPLGPAVVPCERCSWPMCRCDIM